MTVPLLRTGSFRRTRESISQASIASRGSTITAVCRRLWIPMANDSRQARTVITGLHFVSLRR